MVELNIYLPRAMEIKILLFWLFLISFFLRLAFLLTQAHQKTQSRYQTTRKKLVCRSERKQQYLLQYSQNREMAKAFDSGSR